MLPPDRPDRRASSGRRRGVQRRLDEPAPEPVPPHERPRSVVMFVGTDPTDVRLLQDMLQSSSAEPFELVTVAERADALERVTRGGVDVVLLDLLFPGGVDWFEALSAARSVAPFLVLSRAGDERLALDAVRAGAQDALVKGRFDGVQLAQTLRYAIERHRVRSEMGELALLDELTGLHNRRGFVMLATQDLNVARRAKQPLLVAFGDLDDLKGINDRLGHAEGDTALRDVAGVLRRTFRESDLIARIGGDEFAVLVRSSDEGGVEALRKRLDEQLTDFNRRAGRRFQLSISLGFAHRAAATVTSVESLLGMADLALYQEKHRRASAPANGGNGASGRASVPLTQEGASIEILLVEDEPSDIELTQLALMHAKLQNRLSVVTDGVEALAFLRGEGSYDATPRPDVVLLDLMLPKLSGREVLAEMRRDPALRDIPVIILTGTNAEHTALEALKPDAFLTKPVDFERLAQAVGAVANLGFTIVKLPT